MLGGRFFVAKLDEAYAFQCSSADRRYSSANMIASERSTASISVGDACDTENYSVASRLLVVSG